jgi:(p)ppGpp synthase/HD superfamily hydrolase
MATLERAIQIAAAAHEGQRDKGGREYILHPLRVMFRVNDSPYITDPETRTDAMIVSVLHDVLEDTAVTEQDLSDAGFDHVVMSALKALTRIEDRNISPRKEIYLTEFIPRIAKDPLARIVKLADLADNMDPNRVPPGQEGVLHESQLRKYAKAKAYIEKQIELEAAEKLVKKLKEELGQ